MAKFIKVHAASDNSPMVINTDFIIAIEANVKSDTDKARTIISMSNYTTEIKVFESVELIENMLVTISALN